MTWIIFVNAKNIANTMHPKKKKNYQQIVQSIPTEWESMQANK